MTEGDRPAEDEPVQEMELEEPAVSSEEEFKGRAGEDAQEEETPEPAEPEAEESVQKVGAGGTALSFWAGLTGSLACVWSLAAAFSLLLSGESELAATGQVIMACVSLAVILATLLTFRHGSVGPMFGGILAMFGGLLCLGVLVESAISLGMHVGDIQVFALGGWAMVRGFIGLTGLLIFSIFVGKDGWARRSVALTLFCLLIVGAAVWGGRAAIALQGELRSLEPLRAEMGPLLVSLLGGLMVAFSVANAARSEHLTIAQVMGSMAGLLVAGSAAGYTCYSFASVIDWKVTALRTVQIAWPLVVAALVPVVLTTIWWAWETRSGIDDDALACCRFGWGLAFPVTLVAIAIWLPSALPQGQFETGVVVLGGAALLLAAFIGIRRDPWVARWTLFPAILGAVAVLGSMAAFRNGIVPEGSWLGRILGTGPGIFFWLLMVIPAILATGGLAVATRLARGSQAHRSDANIIYTAGWTISGAVLLLIYTVSAGNPELVEHVQASVTAISRGAADALHVMTGAGIADEVSAGFARFGEVVFAGGWAGRIGIALGLVFLIGVHVGARHGSRWCSWFIAVLWALIITALVALTAVAGFRLFSPPAADQLSTLWGRSMATSLTLRLLAVALLLGLLWRLYDSMKGVHYLATQKSEEPQAAVPESRFSSLASLGIMGCVAGLILAFMLGVDVSSEAVLFHLEQIAVDLRASFVFIAADAAISSTMSTGAAFCTAAVLVMGIALHEETRRGRISAYPWVALLWLGLLARLGVGGYRRLSALSWPVPPGERLAIVVVGLLWLIFLVGAFALLRRWLLLLREEGKHHLEPTVTGRVSGSAKMLGLVGLALSVTAAAMVVYVVLWKRPALTGQLQVMERGLERGSALVVNAVEGWQEQLQERNLLSVVATAVGLVSAVLLVFHFLAQRGIRWAGIATTAVWSGASVAGIGLYGRMVDFSRFGSWEVDELLGALIAALAIMGLLAATASSWVHVVSRGRKDAQPAGA